MRDAAAHDDPFRAEKMDHAGKPRAEISGLFPEQREVVSPWRAPSTMWRPSIICDAHQMPSKPSGCIVAAWRARRPSAVPRGESFEASDRPARANWPFDRHAKMPDMARHATTAVQEPTIDHNPATDASADRHLDEMSQAATSAIDSETLLKVSSQAFSLTTSGFGRSEAKILTPGLRQNRERCLRPAKALCRSG